MSLKESKISVLDHGYVKLVEHWGSEERIIEAARMSTNKGFLGWGDDEKSGDEKLLRYLYTHKHYTPFEMAGMIIEVQAPIFVFREWHRHRTQSYNELSARYTPLPDFNYVPSVDRCLVVDEKNKQAGKIKGADELTHTSALEWLEELQAVYEHAEEVYQSGLQRGVPKELARLPVPVGRYSRMRASTNLRNWLGFFSLRLGKDVQQETRDFACAAAMLVSELFPRTWNLYEEQQG